jgi:hypothetical protein
MADATSVQDLPAQSVGSLNQADAVDEQRLRESTNIDKGMQMDRERWYAFMDGPRDRYGNLTSARAGLVWIGITFSIAVLWSGLVAFAAYGAEWAALGFGVLLLPCVGPLVFASVIACVKTTLDVLLLLGKRLIPGP